jgi:hypothetical protein
VAATFATIVIYMGISPIRNRNIMEHKEFLMVLSYDVPITFGRNGTAKELDFTGIDFSDGGTQSWTSAPVAELGLQFPPARQDVVLHLEASPFVIPDVISAQHVFVFIGGSFIGFCIFKGHGVMAFSVGRSIMSGRPNRMCLVLPNATSPSASFIGDDKRELGICLSVRLRIFRVIRVG